jgi:hypothetical protein
MRIDRRRFLRLAGSGVALALAPTGCSTDAGYDAASLAQPELLAAMGPELVRALGARYRALTPAERDAGALREAILDSRPLPARLLGARHPVADLVRDDFARGRTVVVDGWILAATEARQCALFSLRPA